MSWPKRTARGWPSRSINEGGIICVIVISEWWSQRSGMDSFYVLSRSGENVHASDNKMGLTFFGFFDGFGVGRTSSSATARFLVLTLAVVDRVVRDDIQGVGVAGWSLRGGGGMLVRVLAADRPPRILLVPTITQVGVKIATNVWILDHDLYTVLRQ